MRNELGHLGTTLWKSCSVKLIKPAALHGPAAPAPIRSETSHCSASAGKNEMYDNAKPVKTRPNVSQFRYLTQLGISADVS